MNLDLSTHPCFNPASRHTYARVHLPVAPACNIQCNYCNRKFDCANENRPGVTTTVLSPGQALYYMKRAVELNPAITVAGIAGPGDAFATPDCTLDTLSRIRNEFSEMLLCVASNGLNVTPYVSQLADIDVSHITITLNTIDAEIGSMIYAWVRDGKKTYRGYDAAKLLLDRQLEAIETLKKHDVVVKINTIIIPGVNDTHIPTLASFLKDQGVDIMNCIPMYPVEDTPFEELGTPSSEQVMELRKECRQHLPMMSHCTRCRADAIGWLGNDDTRGMDVLTEASQQPIEPEQDRPYIAVASLEGVLINQHLGEANEVWVFETKDDQYSLVECRTTPPPGGGAKRWSDLALSLNDCRAFLVSSAGDTPIRVLEESGIAVHRSEGLIDEALRAMACGQPIRKPLTAVHRCGSGCSGDAMGCN